MLGRCPLFVASTLIIFSAPASVWAMVVSTTHPDQNAWYASRDVSLSWDVPSDTVAVRTLYDNAAHSVPSKVYVPPIREKSFTADEDGTHYFHVQFKKEDGWGEVAHYKLQIDTRAPSGLSVSFPDGSTAATPQPTILVTANDETSGVKDILISVDGEATTTHSLNASNFYTLPKRQSGKHVATVTVRDHAGNASRLSVEYSVLPIDPPEVTEYTRFSTRGDTLRVKGTTYPFSTVQVAYEDVKTGERITGTTHSEDDGSFLYLMNKGIPAGVYEMRVRVTDRQGIESEFTSPRVVGIESATLTRVGTLIVNWLSLALIVIMAGTLVTALFWYSVLQFGRFRRRVRKTMQEAEYALKMNVAALRRDTEEFHTILKKAEKKRDLTKEEQTILRKFTKRLDVTEKEIEKKLGQIGG